VLKKMHKAFYIGLLLNSYGAIFGCYPFVT